MTGKDIVNFITKHHLEDVDDIVFDNDTINFNITFKNGDWLMYSLFDFGKGEDVVFWPGPKSCLKTQTEISFEDEKSW